MRDSHAGTGKKACWCCLVPVARPTVKATKTRPILVLEIPFDHFVSYQHPDPAKPQREGGPAGRPFAGYSAPGRPHTLALINRVSLEHHRQSISPCLVVCGTAMLGLAHVSASAVYCVSTASDCHSRPSVCPHSPSSAEHRANSDQCRRRPYRWSSSLIPLPLLPSPLIPHPALSKRTSQVLVPASHRPRFFCRRTLMEFSHLNQGTLQGGTITRPIAFYGLCSTPA
ncbi:hypothetical protein BCR34DRAFT_384101 [Clohesyomyces aquaticus]|uniref:Uncharacterized protein n=1 Tax=Clohesyomyces aquaticus TaxID=1231657 RepID=A0A1Y1ZG10_9PLEO|nr:hypothetical protein BCR34DRAFT_384101 [Clohesyomyces aquaticus]